MYRIGWLAADMSDHILAGDACCLPTNLQVEYLVNDHDDVKLLNLHLVPIKPESPGLKIPAIAIFLRAVLERWLSQAFHGSTTLLVPSCWNGDVRSQGNSTP